MIYMMYGMKVLVYGSRGWIGKQFINLLKKNKVNFIEGRESYSHAKVSFSEKN